MAQHSVLCIREDTRRSMISTVVLVPQGSSGHKLGLKVCANSKQESWVYTASPISLWLTTTLGVRGLGISSQTLQALPMYERGQGPEGSGRCRPLNANAHRARGWAQRDSGRIPVIWLRHPGYLVSTTASIYLKVFPKLQVSMSQRGDGVTQMRACIC